MPLPGLTTIEVDFNRVRRGLLRGFVHNADGPIKVGQVVNAVDSGDDTERVGVVVEVTDDRVALRILPSASPATPPTNEPSPSR